MRVSPFRCAGANAPLLRLPGAPRPAAGGALGTSPPQAPALAPGHLAPDDPDLGPSSPSGARVASLPAPAVVVRLQDDLLAIPSAVLPAWSKSSLARHRGSPRLAAAAAAPALLPAQPSQRPRSLLAAPALPCARFCAITAPPHPLFPPSLYASLLRSPSAAPNRFCSAGSHPPRSAPPPRRPWRRSLTSTPPCASARTSQRRCKRAKARVPCRVSSSDAASCHQISPRPRLACL